MANTSYVITEAYLIFYPVEKYLYTNFDEIVVYLAKWIACCYKYMVKI